MIFASKADVKAIKESLNLESPLEVLGNPNRPNIFYEKIFRKARLDIFDELLATNCIRTEEKYGEFPVDHIVPSLKMVWLCIQIF